MNSRCSHFAFQPFPSHLPPPCSLASPPESSYRQSGTVPAFSTEAFCLLGGGGEQAALTRAPSFLVGNQMPGDLHRVTNPCVVFNIAQRRVREGKSIKRACKVHGWSLRVIANTCHAEPTLGKDALRGTLRLQSNRGPRFPAPG